MNVARQKKNALQTRLQLVNTGNLMPLGGIIAFQLIILGNLANLQASGTLIMENCYLIVRIDFLNLTMGALNLMQDHGVPSGQIHYSVSTVYGGQRTVFCTEYFYNDHQRPRTTY